jgi:hypothetical protein
MSVWLLNPLGHTHDEGLCFLRNFVKGNRSQVLAAALHALRPPHLPLHGRAPTGKNAPVPHSLKPHNPGRTCTQCLRSFIFATHSKKGAVHRTDAVRGERKMSKPQEPSASTGGCPYTGLGHPFNPLAGPEYDELAAFYAQVRREEPVFFSPALNMWGSAVTRRRSRF